MNATLEKYDLIILDAKRQCAGGSPTFVAYMVRDLAVEIERLEGMIDYAIKHQGLEIDDFMPSEVKPC
jgi:hypothetical protein